MSMQQQPQFPLGTLGLIGAPGVLPSNSLSPIDRFVQENRLDDGAAKALRNDVNKAYKIMFGLQHMSVAESDMVVSRALQGYSSVCGVSVCGDGGGDEAAVSRAAGLFFACGFSANCLLMFAPKFAPTQGPA